jgi:hypothetical protein
MDAHRCPTSSRNRNPWAAGSQGCNGSHSKCMSRQRCNVYWATRHRTVSVSQQRRWGVASAPPQQPASHPPCSAGMQALAPAPSACHNPAIKEVGSGSGLNMLVSMDGGSRAVHAGPGPHPSVTAWSTGACLSDLQLLVRDLSRWGWVDHRLLRGAVCDPCWLLPRIHFLFLHIVPVPAAEGEVPQLGCRRANVDVSTLAHGLSYHPCMYHIYSSDSSTTILMASTVLLASAAPNSLSCAGQCSRKQPTFARLHLVLTCHALPALIGGHLLACPRAEAPLPAVQPPAGNAKQAGTCRLHATAGVGAGVWCECCKRWRAARQQQQQRRQRQLQQQQQQQQLANRHHTRCIGLHTEAPIPTLSCRRMREGS